MKSKFAIAFLGVMLACIILISNSNASSFYRIYDHNYDPEAYDPYDKDTITWEIDLYINIGGGGCNLQMRYFKFWGCEGPLAAYYETDYWDKVWFQSQIFWYDGPRYYHLTTELDGTPPAIAWGHSFQGTMQDLYDYIGGVWCYTDWEVWCEYELWQYFYPYDKITSGQMPDNHRVHYELDGTDSIYDCRRGLHRFLSMDGIMGGGMGRKFSGSILGKYGK